MIFGCLTSIIALIFAFILTIVIFAITGVAITFGLLVKILIPFILIGLGIKVITRNKG
ncbi:hypothetical protein [Clostridium sp. Cult1]|uniref:hypothetical protein n=1 Tax=Clostridium sp. Cult1 TaxID=2079002 RepID=UPI001F41F534|nr:hypothetical protein [Clostridium sp. Cult1]